MLIKENQSILIPIDFSKQSLITIEQTYSLAKHTRSKFVLMHVEKDAVNRASELEELAEKTRKESGLSVDTLNLTGDVYELTDKKAQELKSSLIVIGLDTKVRFRNFFGNNNVGKFINNAPCPIITIRNLDNRNNCKNIVLPFDLSAESREKVPIVVQIARYFQADIRIVSVFDPNDEKYENELFPYLNQVKQFIKQEGLNCTNKSIPSSHPAETIVEYADKNNCDLIIQMNKRDLSIGEMFSGAMSQKVVEISNIPVMSINPMKRESISSGIH